jgi:catechol 2,3-dioxygenase-like lactoylglutathione lyase family enzyme
MELGSFSISLSVKNLRASRSFYEKLGFIVAEGEEEQDWLILRNGEATIGLYQGVLDGNMLTFNPADVRSVEKRLKSSGLAVVREINGDAGPGHLLLEDPDGNTILIDQY